MMLNSLFKKREISINTYSDFWDWFITQEKKFHKVIEKGEKAHIEQEFFNKIAPKLNKLKDGFFYLTGMCDENTAELILTADGNIQNIVYVEELIESAPHINGWKFTALKPALDIKDNSVEMDGIKFTARNMFFNYTIHPDYPDEIDIKVIHDDFSEDNKNTIVLGAQIYLDNLLGELNYATIVDAIKFVSKEEAGQELIHISKLSDFLNWRQKEFVEKYDNAHFNEKGNQFTVFEAGKESENKFVAIINTGLLQWDAKASHPWMVVLEIKYNGTNGMPDKLTSALLDEIEDKILLELKDSEGYLYVGRETGNNIREIYFACSEFRKPSKVLYSIQKKYLHQKISYDIYKDKYWRTFNRFL
jgi:hypothetical protein